MKSGLRAERACSQESMPMRCHARASRRLARRAFSTTFIAWAVSPAAARESAIATAEDCALTRVGAAAWIAMGKKKGAIQRTRGRDMESTADGGGGLRAPPFDTPRTESVARTVQAACTRN